ncbi:MAG TPA: phospho-N-acetylmuramoyl-pentapeptide-transferase [Erysipelotrichaceae bacterium]|nr:MAG: phospho-N-acetylmuramoyl-pentapeptide-transferase [Firmicutes bacterium GWE2_51_13]HAO60636.1 phospho-N-acetylmuramoyl-pentapeptide-transferase [Erysipelotrichaceae bacterium]HBZ41293.1 phospho-N-acetylmuramoyl-pentapeptide-transferase [Erysipelotrichaceae bacterium]
MKPILALILGFLSVVTAMPFFINYLNRKNTSQSVSEYSLKEFKEKKKTPTMGGVLFVLFPVVTMTILYPQSWLEIKSALVYLAYLAYGGIGLWDDLKIVIEKKNDGISARTKFTAQVILAVVFYLLYRQSASSVIVVPFTGWEWNLGWLYAVLVFFMFAGASNGVNLTDGMDGLAGGTSLLAFVPFATIAYLRGEEVLFAFILACIGALIAYLRYNWHPAKIFMGDTGALALGGVLAALAFVMKLEFALLVIGGVFVFETVCVILQIGSVKLRKKRIFIYTPIHYAFTMSGWKEKNTVLFFWFLGALCAFLGILIGVSA